MSATILITGGAGFIGSHVVRLFVKEYPEAQIVNLDSLTYAGNLENLKDVEREDNYRFIKADICDAQKTLELFEEVRPSHVIHLAAESHVDRSITNPTTFVMTNVIGTTNLLNAAKHIWSDGKGVFHHVSTDEVYGSLGVTGLFTESTPYDPRSPYSASKAASDHLVRAYANTFDMDVRITNCSNNYGPNQFPEKLIPLFINNIKHKKALPVYGDGLYTRDWLYVEDHAEAIRQVLFKGKSGETYNIGGHNEWKNIDLIELLCDVMDDKLGRQQDESRQLITFIKDRPGHDRRYAIDASKVEREIGWKPSLTFQEGLVKTVEWYLAQEEWLDQVTSGKYMQYYTNQYAKA